MSFQDEVQRFNAMRLRNAHGGAADSGRREPVCALHIKPHVLLSRKHTDKFKYIGDDQSERVKCDKMSREIIASGPGN
jgi:hypothetical protein